MMPGGTPALWGPNLISNIDAADFEAGIGSWGVGAQSSAVAQSNGTTDPASGGTHSLKITKNATAGGALCVNGATIIPVVGSTLYYCTFEFYTVKPSVVFNINWEFYGGGTGLTFLSITQTANCTAVQGANTPPYDNSKWTRYPPVSLTSDATATFTRLNIQMVSGLTTGDLVWIDNVYVGRRLVHTGAPSVNQTMNRAATR